MFLEASHAPVALPNTPLPLVPLDIPCVWQGNHELESIDGAPEDFTAYLARWRMPYQRSGSPSPLFYSYETGPAHIVMLGSYADYGRHSAQVRPRTSSAGWP